MNEPMMILRRERDGTARRLFAVPDDAGRKGAKVEVEPAARPASVAGHAPLRV